MENAIERNSAYYNMGEYVELSFHIIIKNHIRYTLIMRLLNFKFCFIVL